MGSAISVLGILIYLAGWLWLVAMAVEKHVGWAFFMFCCASLAAWIFILTNLKRWRELLVALGLMYGGGGVFFLGQAIDPWEAIQGRGSTRDTHREAPSDPSPGMDTEVEAASAGPTPEELRQQAYLEFHQAVRNSMAKERLALVSRWREEGFDAVDGGWRDLIESLASGPSSDALEAAQLAETARLKPSYEEIVHVLPKVQPAVRRGLLARFRKATDAERESALAALSQTDDLDNPAILEAYLVLGVVTAYRVSRMIRAEGLAWTKDPVLGEAVRARAREKPAFVEALFANESPMARVYACSLVEFLPGDGDERLSTVLPLLRDPMSDVRLAAAEALAPLANPRASWGLARALGREGDAHVKERMLATLAALDPTPTLGLIVRLQRRKAPDDQRSAALALQAFDPASVLEFLNLALTANDAAVVEAGLQSVLALALREGGEALAPCREAVAALEDTGPLAELRAQVLAALDG